ncbi:hypothetical protein BX616_001990 [Lobosporangium transversale]|nr:hypothetical protein BX616_001990 [Lobosporangium transversale]
MDLVRCRAVCHPWRSMIQRDTGLWKAKVRAWNPAECLLLKDYQFGATTSVTREKKKKHWDPVPRLAHASEGGEGINGPSNEEDISSGTTTTASAIGDSDKEGETLLDRIGQEIGFAGWEDVLIQELALKQNWRQGRYVYEMSVTLGRNIKPSLLAWPFLFLVDDWPRLYKISLDRVREDGFKVVPVGNEKYAKALELQGHGAVSCMAWDQTQTQMRTQTSIRQLSSAGGEAAVTGTDIAIVETLSLPMPLAIGGFLRQISPKADIAIHNFHSIYNRSVRVCNPDSGVGFMLPDVQHGFPLHVCFLRKQVLSVTLDGQITFFQKGGDYRPIRSCTVGTKVLQITPLRFNCSRSSSSRGSSNSYVSGDGGDGPYLNSKSSNRSRLRSRRQRRRPSAFKREHNGHLISWSEVICLAHEDGIIVKDEHSYTLCNINLELGSKLLQFSVIADDVTFRDADSDTDADTETGIEADTGTDTDANTEADTDTDVGTNVEANAWTDSASSHINIVSSHVNNTPHHHRTDDFPRNELMLLFEDPNTRQRRVMRVKMSAGFQYEISRQILTPSFSLGRGGDARDSMTMYRDRIAIVSHRHCSSDLGHYCVLRLMDLKEDFAATTEYTEQVVDDEGDDEYVGEDVDGDSNSKEIVFEVGGGGRQKQEQEEKRDVGSFRSRKHPRIQRPGKPIHLNDFAGHKAACRILAMDHARIVLGMGPRIVKVLYLV